MDATCVTISKTQLTLAVRFSDAVGYHLFLPRMLKSMPKPSEQLSEFSFMLTSSIVLKACCKENVILNALRGMLQM